MEFKISLKWSLVIIIFVGSLLLIITNFFPNNKEEDFFTNVISLEESNFSVPSNLKIPVIDVDAFIEQVGITKEGAMDVPKGPSNAAWFNIGTIPGEVGSAVISGHYGWKDNIRAVFDDLNKLQIGDKVYVENEKGETITFVVREIKTYKENADASDVFSSNDGKSHLNLITCEGIWNEVKKGRPNRLVIFTDRE